jgi:hypothetical protein
MEQKNFRIIPPNFVPPTFNWNVPFYLKDVRTKLTSKHRALMSGFGGKADMASSPENVRF